MKFMVTSEKVGMIEMNEFGEKGKYEIEEMKSLVTETIYIPIDRQFKGL